METSNTLGNIGNRNTRHRHPGILYPLMVIAAIAVIVFSVAGIATMMGWMPSVSSRTEPTPDTRSEPAASARGEPAAKTGGAMQPNRQRIASPAACPDCGVVESIRPFETKGEGSALGVVGGAVVGGVLGNQIGRGSGRTAATVVGAGAGAYAGHEIERNVNKSVRYQVRVRMSDGSYRTFTENAPPALSVGQKVRVTERGIVAG